jgi:hypothetical protein
MRIRIRIEPFKFIAANFCSFVKIYKNMQQYFFQSFPKIKASQIEPKVYFDVSLKRNSFGLLKIVVFKSNIQEGII